jgi:hypothetical protein
MSARIMDPGDAVATFGIALRYIAAEDEVRALKRRELDLLIENRRLRAKLGVAERRVAHIEALTGLGPASVSAGPPPASAG